MKITYLFTLIFTLVIFSTFGQSETDSTTQKNSIYKLIDKEDTKTLQQLIDTKGIGYFTTNQDISYLDYAITNCKISVVEILAKNKLPLGSNREETEAILEGYIIELGCYLKKDAKKCLVPAFVVLIENDYVPITPTLLSQLNCYEDVVPEWYEVIQPIVKALLNKKLKVEESIIHIGEEKDSFLLAICKWEKKYTEEGNKHHQKAIRNYILFLKKQGVDFQTPIQGQKPIDLLSLQFQQKMK